MIRRQLRTDLGLAIHEVVGQLDEVEFRQAGMALYELDDVPLLSFWDLSRASLGAFDLDRLRTLQARVVPLVRGRQGGKTALVAPEAVTFGIVRQYISLADAMNLPFEQKVFRTREEAASWLGVEVGDLSGQDASEEAL